MHQWVHAHLRWILQTVLRAQWETRLNSTDLQTRRSFR